MYIYGKHTEGSFLIPFKVLEDTQGVSMGAGGVKETIFAKTDGIIIHISLLTTTLCAHERNFSVMLWSALSGTCLECLLLRSWPSRA